MANRRTVTGLSFTWEQRYRGWALCTISDDHSQAEAVASDVTGGPQYLFRAVTSIARGAESARASFEAEPTEYRWSSNAADPTSTYGLPGLRIEARLIAKKS